MPVAGAKAGHLPMEQCFYRSVNCRPPPRHRLTETCQRLGKASRAILTPLQAGEAPLPGPGRGRYSAGVDTARGWNRTFAISSNPTSSTQMTFATISGQFTIRSP